MAAKTAEDRKSPVNKKPAKLIGMRARDRRNLRKAVESVMRDDNVTLESLLRGRGLSYSDQSLIGSNLRWRLQHLRRRPICKLDATDLGTLIHQRYGHFYLLPTALNMLERDPMAYRQFYPGELLATALHVLTEDWAVVPELLARFAAVIDRVLAGPLADASALDEYGRTLRSWAERYRQGLAGRFPINHDASAGE